MRWFVPFTLVLLASCPPSQEQSVDGSSLRLGTHMGLAPMEPTVASTITRNMVELVYAEPLSSYFVSVQANGTEVRLVLRTELVEEGHELAAAMTHPELVSASVDQGVVIARFRTLEAAAAIALEDHIVAIGSYEPVPDDSGAERLVLSSRSTSDGPKRIEVVKVATEDEAWRRLIAGEFDLLPSVLPGTIRYLEQIPSLRIVRYENSQTAALWFRVGRGATASLEVRRAIAHAIRRRPLALNVTGDAEVARAADENMAWASASLSAAGFSADAPLRLQLVVLEAQPDLVRASMVIQQQLATVGVDIEIVALSVDAFTARLLSNDFDLCLFYGDTKKRNWHNFRRGALANFAGYASADFEAAADANDEAKAELLLMHDLPLTTLYDLNEAAVVRRGFCAVHPKASDSLAWLAEIRPCKIGEVE